ncbi:MAG: tetratricopeptide repeat protein [Chloroflexi bacterium]|nr:tetratricopeptide repeat protein [Chloroflexota bacterium]
MTSIPVSKTKIVLPRRRAGYVTRKRLLDLLFDSLDKKLVFISAPAGYGKTSLLIDLAQQSELPCCWLALDEMDREPQRFIAYLIASITERFPEFGSKSASMLASLTSFEQDVERMLVTLVNETYEQIHEHFILVLDDFHLVENVQPILAFVNRFIQLVDENCHIIISSRILTSMPDLSLMVAREQVTGLGFSDLAFNVEEIQAFFAQNKNLQISDEEAENMIEKTEGWITGLQFSAVGGASAEFIKPATGTGVGLSDFLGQQVLDRQSPALREFLLRTSMLGEFDAPLCQAVLAPLYVEPQNWQGLISEVVQNNIFVLPVGADGRWMRYHHLFRDFLRTRFEQAHPAEVKPILMNLGRAFENLEEWEKAYYIYRQLNDREILAEMIERASTSMLKRAIVTLESWLGDLPPSMLRTRPGLLSIRGAIIYMKGNLREGLSLLDQAEHIFRSDKNLPGLAMTLARRGVAYRFIGDFTASLQDANEVIEMTEARDDLQTLYAEALRVKGLALYRLGQARQAVDFFEKSLNLYYRLNDTSSIPILLMETGMIYNALGNYAEAGASYERALQIWRKEGNLSWQANLLNNLGVLRHFQGDYEKASLAYEEGMVCAQRSGYTRMEAVIAIGLGDMYAELEDILAAQSNYLHAQEIVQGMNDRFLLFYLTTAQASLALLQKNSMIARQKLEDAAARIQSSDSLYENGLLNLGWGRLSLMEGESLRAVDELEEAEHCFTEDGRKMESDASRVWLAAAYYQTNYYEAARKIINTLTGRHGQISESILVAAHQARTWMNGLQRDAEVGRAVGDLLTRAGRMAAKLPALKRQLHRMSHVVEIPNPHLIIHAFGKVSVTVGGRPLTHSDWQTQSVRDLFFYFLTSQKPLTKEQVGLTLWPEIDEPQKIKLRFKNDVYRLRRAVGQEVIAYENIYYRFNRALDFEYDVEAFESFLARAKSTANLEEQIEHYQKAVELVKGSFLEDIHADWATLEREHLHQAFITALLTLAELFLKKALPEPALATCQRVLKHEPANEAAYCLTMQIYHRIGDRASIIRTYETYQEVMLRQLGFLPSKEIEELYLRLTR